MKAALKDHSDMIPRDTTMPGAHVADCRIPEELDASSHTNGRAAEMNFRPACLPRLAKGAPAPESCRDAS